MPIPTDWTPPAKMERIVIHWTAGTHRANHVDRKHYHVLIEGDGNVVRGNPGIDLNSQPLRQGYAAHTRGCNTGSIGVAMCGMAAAVERPFQPGPYPLTEPQWRAMVEVVGMLAHRYAIPVTPRTILTHAEVQETLGIAQAGKWDVTHIPFDAGTVGARAVGDKLRREVAAWMGQGAPPGNDLPPVYPSRPILRRGTAGPAVRELQAALNRAGANPLLREDGDYGPATMAAVKALQTVMGLAVDGVAGPQTYRALGLQ